MDESLKGTWSTGPTRKHSRTQRRCGSLLETFAWSDCLCATVTTSCVRDSKKRWRCVKQTASASSCEWHCPAIARQNSLFDSAFLSQSSATACFESLRATATRGSGIPTPLRSRCSSKGQFGRKRSTLVAWKSHSSVSHTRTTRTGQTDHRVRQAF